LRLAGAAFAGAVVAAAAGAVVAAAAGAVVAAAAGALVAAGAAAVVAAGLAAAAVGAGADVAAGAVVGDDEEVQAARMPSAVVPDTPSPSFSRERRLRDLIDKDSSLSRGVRRTRGGVLFGGWLAMSAA
jgi:hypothetical protein